MKNAKLILIGFSFLAITGIITTIIAFTKKRFTADVYYSNGVCTTLDAANIYFTTTGTYQAIVYGDDGNTYNLYSDANCTLPVYFDP